ncbi:LysR family transcriptional regulator [Caballeronia sp. LZ035]|uniref:LysR family transcriptional regulator n=1 Tax=Caballeronia sp. LZ035 TaxID=3038568 RepID=UPI0028591C7B|nr:LysR family transcriptional regulator [Caballeronia sp. LZ035]MDR5756168.1 LysR family transcriptional regulator [Caballeronia sp. LZ035]
MMNQIHAMRVFVRVADTESFRRAAQQLDVSNALVTRAIAMLEAHLRTRLINRTTRNLSLTEAGTRYLEGCRALLEELDHLESAITHTEGEPSGTLRVVASSALSLLTLTPLIDGFRRLHPKVNVRLTLAERHVDLVEDGYDVGIVTAYMVSSTALVERPVGTNTFVPVATPEFLAQHGVPVAPADLLGLPAVALPNEMRNLTWHFRHHLGAADQITLTPVYTVNNGLMVRLGTLKGIGFAILPEGIVNADLKEGTLVRLLPDYAIDDPDIKMSIVYPGRQYLPAKTRFFVDYALDYLSQRFATATSIPDEGFRAPHMAVKPVPASASVSVNAVPAAAN